MVSWKRSFAYGFGIALALLSLGYALMDSNAFGVFAILSWPGIVSGMMLVQSGDAMELKIGAVALIVNGLMYTALVHLARKIWNRLRH
ncbi:MAG: hypothetical protein ABIP12_06745 [Terriglobales bacterium]